MFLASYGEFGMQKITWDFSQKFWHRLTPSIFWQADHLHFPTSEKNPVSLDQPTNIFKLIEKVPSVKIYLHLEFREGAS